MFGGRLLSALKIFGVAWTGVTKLCNQRGDGLHLPVTRRLRKREAYEAHERLASCLYIQLVMLRAALLAILLEWFDLACLLVPNGETALTMS